MSDQTSLPYGENPSLRSLAIDTIASGLQEQYRQRAKRNPSKAAPSPEKLQKLAEFLKERSIRNGQDDYLGTAASRA